MFFSLDSDVNMLAYVVASIFPITQPFIYLNLWNSKLLNVTMTA